MRKVNEKTCQICKKITNGREKTCKEGGTGKNRCSGDFDIKVLSSIDTQLITDTITDEQKELTFDSFDDILFNIREENFDKNPQNECFFFGQKCIYFNTPECYGREGGNYDGLVDMKEEK